jgi:hypothetical protein
MHLLKEALSESEPEPLQGLENLGQYFLQALAACELGVLVHL